MTVSWKQLRPTGITLALLLVLLGLGSFYYFRTEAYADYLRQRNLRQLARMSRSIEAKINNFESIVRNLEEEKQRRSEETGFDFRAQLQMVPSLKSRAPVRFTPAQIAVQQVPPAPTPAPAAPAPPPPDGKESPVTLLVDHHTSSLVLSHRGSSYDYDLAGEVMQYLELEFFDDVFLADADGHILLENGSPQLRLRGIPPPETPKGAAGAPQPGGDHEIAGSAVRRVEIAGRGYWLFLQPIHLKMAPPERAGSSAGESGMGEPGNDWTLGGMVAVEGFRRDSLALDPSELLLLAAILALAVLGWPFLKIWSMGPRERVAVRDVLFLGFSLVLAAGILSLGIVDLAYYPNLKREVDRQLGEMAESLAGKFDRELDAALTQLEELTEEFQARAAQGLLAPDLRVGLKIDEDRPYPFFQMAIWTDSQGMQIAKWTRGSATTPLVSVAHRDYFRRVRDDRLWGDERRRFFIDAIRSVNTGQYLNALSIPCGDPEICTAAVLLNRFAVFDRPVLPPGYSFAVLEPDGRALIHHRPERSLEENFLTETDNNPKLQSILRARASANLDVRYLGKDVRLACRPIGSTPLTLVVLSDKAYLRITNLETLATALILFLAFCLAMLLQFAALAYFGPRKRMRWAWPDRRLPSKYVLSAVVLGLFIVQISILAILYSPRQLLPYAFLVPFQAAGLGLGVLGIGLRGTAHIKGWGVCLTILATLVLVRQEEAVRLWVPLVAPLLSFAAWRIYERMGRLEKRHLPSLRSLYVAGTIASLVVLGTLPAALFFRIVYFDQLKTYVKHGQLAIAEALDERGPAQRSLPGVREPLDLTIEPFFDTCLQASATGWSPCEPPPELARLGAAAAGGESPRSARVQPRIWQVLPFLSRPAIDMRHLFGRGAADGSWQWPDADWATPADEAVRGTRPLLFEYGRAGGRGDAGEGPPPRFRMLSRIPTVLVAMGPGPLLAFVLLFLALWSLVLFESRRVFLIDFEPAGPLDLPHSAASGPIEENLLFICPQQCDKSALFERPEVHRIDLNKLSLPLATDHSGLPPAEEKPVLCVEHFGVRLAEAEWGRDLLGWLETLLYVEGRTLVLISARDPDHLLFGAAPAGTEAVDELTRQRWIRLLGEFRKISVTPRAPTAAFASDLAKRREELLATAAAPPGMSDRRFRRRLKNLFSILESECRIREPLQTAGRAVMARPDFHLLSPDALLEQLQETAEGTYRLLWSNLSRDEKMLVAQIADGALVNPSWRQALRRLLAQGLIQRDPELRLMNRSFGRFVRESVQPEEIATWERDPTGSTWRRIRQPLFVGLILVAVFLFATQRQLFNTGMAFISALAVGIPAMFKLMGLLRTQGEDSGPS